MERQRYDRSVFIGEKSLMENCKMINFLRKVKANVVKELKWNTIKKDFLNNMKGNYIVLIGTPLHGNIGDQAITLAEYEYFEKLGYRVCEIPSPYVISKMEFLKKHITSEKIYVHGGGFIGSLWPDEEFMFEAVLKEFSQNQIIVLPQTIYVDNDDALLPRLNGLLNKCKDVTICAREEESYRFSKENLTGAKIELVPDMVLSQVWTQKAEKKERICFCMRKDREKVLKDSEMKQMMQMVKKAYPNADIYFTDTVEDRDVTHSEREEMVKGKIREFASCELIITDRLHGMVLAGMSGTKTMVWSNCNYKVLGIYRWIKDNRFISYISNIEMFEAELQRLCEYKETCRYCNGYVKPYFETLEKLIRR